MDYSYDTAGLVVRVIAGGVVVCGATIATGGIAAAAGASAATGTAMMSAAAMTGGLAVAGMAATDYVSGRLSSYESYMKTALAGSVVGAMTGAAAYAPVSGGLAHGALDLGTGMAGDALMQLAMTEKVDGEQMFYSGMVSVLLGAVVRGGGIVEEGGSAAEGAVRKNNAPRIKGGKVNTVNSKPVTNTDNLDDLRYEQYWDDVKAGKYDIPYGMTEDEYYEFLKGMDKVDEVIKGGSGALEGPRKIPKPGDSDFVGPLTKSEQHFIYGDGIGPKKRGVLGAHNLESFDNTLKSTGYSLEDLKVGDPIPHPTVDGVYAQYYRVPAYDGRGNFIGFKDIPDPKTYYDPGIISNSQMLQWGKEAMNNANPIGDGGYLIKGTASNGLEFYGYLRDGDITNFFPSVPK